MEAFEEDMIAAENTDRFNTVNATQDYKRLAPGLQVVIPILPSNLVVQHKPATADALRVECENLKKNGKVMRDQYVQAISAIRWRHKRDELNVDGTKKIESNARLVKWSDGSMSLMIGDKTSFSLQMKPEKNQFLLSNFNEELGFIGQAAISSTVRCMPESAQANELRGANRLSVEKKSIKHEDLNTVTDQKTQVLFDRKTIQNVSQSYRLSLQELESSVMSRRGSHENDIHRDRRILDAKNGFADPIRKRSRYSQPQLSGLPEEDDDDDYDMGDDFINDDDDVEVEEDGLLDDEPPEESFQQNARAKNEKNREARGLPKRVERAELPDDEVEDEEDDATESEDEEVEEEEEKPRRERRERRPKEKEPEEEEEVHEEVDVKPRESVSRRSRIIEDEAEDGDEAELPKETPSKAESAPQRPVRRMVIDDDDDDQ
eukprot:TRINITY_DN1851_c0_g1_i1.p1 TRINITY_DN1851_c0_g1~~TRINITY_DN1851_c0_g1_i1.p1  ORF type:complete len:449 (-),score=189.74 TRINITY_DN1851_c0_g1_i1:11-1309(-)